MGPTRTNANRERAQKETTILSGLPDHTKIPMSDNIITNGVFCNEYGSGDMIPKLIEYGQGIVRYKIERNIPLWDKAVPWPTHKLPLVSGKKRASDGETLKNYEHRQPQQVPQPQQTTFNMFYQPPNPMLPQMDERQLDVIERECLAHIAEWSKTSGIKLSALEAFNAQKTSAAQPSTAVQTQQASYFQTPAMPAAQSSTALLAQQALQLEAQVKPAAQSSAALQPQQASYFEAQLTTAVTQAPPQPEATIDPAVLDMTSRSPSNDWSDIFNMEAAALETPDLEASTSTMPDIEAPTSKTPDPIRRPPTPDNEFDAMMQIKNFDTLIDDEKWDFC